ncbi:MAG TPA: MFS transporter [Candidatus Nitrosotenuis sp.]|nr:MFS transporter [Candidatus Nitrosotenuis sp.]
MRGYSREFWKGMPVLFLGLAGHSMLFLLPRYFEAHGLARWQIGLGEGAYWMASVLIQPWLGRRLDRGDRRIYLAAGSLAMGLVALSYLALPVDPFTVVLFRALQGLALAVFFTSLWAWVSELVVPARMVEMLGLFGISGLVGTALGPSLGEAVLARQGYPGVFAGAAGLMVLAGLTVLTFAPQRVEAGVAAASSGFWRLAASPALLAPLLSCLSFGISMGTLVGFAAPYTASLHLPGVGWFFSPYFLMSGVTRLVWGDRTDRAGAARVIPPALLLLAGGVGGLSLLAAEGWRGVPLLVAAGLLGGVGDGLVYPAMSALVIQRAGPSARGRGMSLVTGTVNLGAFTGALVAGLAAHLAGYPAMCFLMGALMALATLLFALLEARRPPLLLETGPLPASPGAPSQGQGERASAEDFPSPSSQKSGGRKPP